jgi:hypothetical protein
VPEIIARQMLVLRVDGKGVLRGCVSWIIRGYVVVSVASVLLQMFGSEIIRCEWKQAEVPGGWGLFEWATIVEAVEFAS